MITADAAGTWQLGDLTVNRLGYGAMRLTGDPSGDGGPSDRGQSVAVLRRAVEFGVNHIDTAAFCLSRLRSANELINTALAPYPDGLVIATKVGPWRDSRRPEADDVLKTCAERGIAFVPFFAIAGEGREGGKRATEREQPRAITWCVA